VTRFEALVEAGFWAQAKIRGRSRIKGHFGRGVAEVLVRARSIEGLDSVTLIVVVLRVIVEVLLRIEWLTGSALVLSLLLRFSLLSFLRAILSFS
jgi:hypothetical protein